MKLTVIGHLCKDVIHLPNDSFDAAPQSYGGIFFSVVSLAGLLAESDTIMPVFGVGAAEYDDVLTRLRQYPNVDIDGIFRIKGKTNEVHLFYDANRSTRIECSKEIAAPIPYSRIKPNLDTDGILVNLISGFDLTLETLDTMRMEVRDKRIPIHLDLHSLTLGVDEENKRFRRPVPDWRRWCFMMNSVQMSEEEAAGLTAEHFDEQTLINHLMPLMVNDLLITRGEGGATLVHQDIHKKLTRFDRPAFEAGPVCDTTGCGDVFGAAFVAEFVKGRDHLRAFEAAITAAGINATMRSAAELSGLGTLVAAAMAKART